MKWKIKKGDKVFVLAGKEKGKTALVKEIITGECKAKLSAAKVEKMKINSTRVILEGINLAKCFSKKKSLVNESKTKEMSMHISNISHIDPKTSKPTRVKVLIEGEKKSLVAKSGMIIREITKAKKTIIGENNV